MSSRPQCILVAELGGKTGMPGSKLICWTGSLGKIKVYISFRLVWKKTVSKIYEGILGLLSLGRKGTIYFLEGCWCNKNLIYPGWSMNRGGGWGIGSHNQTMCGVGYGWVDIESQTPMGSFFACLSSLLFRMRWFYFLRLVVSVRLEPELQVAIGLILTASWLMRKEDSLPVLIG